MRLGFIGTGTITEAIITGLCREPGPIRQIRVSPRSRKISTRLSQRHGIARAEPSNQAVADKANIVFLAFLPGMEEEILNALVFREEQTIVTLLAGTPLERISPLVSPAQKTISAVPLPCTALNTGPIAMYPGNASVEAVFSRVGSVIVPGRESQLETFSLITALMAPFYALTDTVAAWGCARGLDQAQAAAYTGAMFKALALIAETAPQGDIQGLIQASMTPGGLNETAMGHISDCGGFSGITAALDTVAERFG